MWACGVNGVIRTHMTISSVRLDVDPAVCTSLSSRPVVPGSAGGAMAPPDFGKSVNPISTRGWGGVDYAHQIIVAPSDFQNFQRP